MKNLLLATICILSISVAVAVLAHQPRLVESDFTLVENPEISQAFYGQLNGEPAYFKINSAEPFKLYINVLVPDLPDIRKDISAKVYLEENKELKQIILLDGLNYDWAYFYEEFAGDGYYMGPEERGDLDKGVYIIEVFNSDNQGKYSLVVGEKEEFPAGEILNTVKVLPKLKSDFFEKSPLAAYFNRIGLFIFGPIIILLAIVIFIAIYIKKKRGNMAEKNENLGRKNKMPL